MTRSSADRTTTPRPSVAPRGRRGPLARAGARFSLAALLISLLIGGCGRGAGGRGGAPAEARAPAAPPLPAWQVRAAGGQRPIDPGIELSLGPGAAGAPSAAQRALLDAESCRGCHADQHAEWADSRHALAWTNGIFQREYSAQPRAWCVNCHAPLTVQQAGLAAGDARLANQGVSCAACHVRGGRLVSSRQAAGSPHVTVVDASFASPAMCADCHQFTFPVMSPRDGEVVRMTSHPMQSTVSDFLAGPYAGSPEGCFTCHDTRFGHGFPGGHDLDLLRVAISSSWCRDERDQVVIEVGNVGAGHRVPTGDIHRHLLARLWRSSAPEATFEAFFGRRYAPAPDGGKRITWDSTLAPGQRRRFAVPATTLASPARTAAPSDEPDAPAELAAEELAERRAAELALLAEPINFEVTYVYTLDEFPRVDRMPGEPVTAQLKKERLRLAELPRCAPVLAPSTVPLRTSRPDSVPPL